MRARRIVGSEKEGGSVEGHKRDVRSATFAPRRNNASQIIMDV